MNDIQVGEYVRLNRNQGINRIEDIENDYYVLEDYYADEDGDETFCLYKYKVNEEILKHSFNIIDLIEVGDYVNGRYIQKITPQLIYFRNCAHTRKDSLLINDIVTHEQFESIKYIVKEKEE